MLPKPLQLLLSILSLPLFLLLLSSPVSAANLGLTPATTTLAPGQTTTVTVGLNTGGKSTVGADAHINFNSSLIEIQSVSFSGSPYAHNFSNNTGSILKLTSSFASPSESYNGAINIATITVKALTAGTANFSFVCTGGATNDTNIVERLTGADLVNCGTLNSPSITIAVGANPTPTPPDSPAPTPTPNNNQGGGICYTPVAPTNLRSAPYTSDSILLTWDHSTSRPEHYSLTYGPSQNQLLYTVGNIGYTNNFLVSFLSANSTYAFGIAAVNSCGQSSTIFTLNKTLAKAGTNTKTVTPPATTLPSKTAGFGSLATGTKKGDSLGQDPTKIAKGDEDSKPSPSPTPGPYTYQEPVAKPQTRTIALVAAILIPILILLWLIFGRRKKKEENILDQNELNMPPISTLTPPPTTTSTYSNLTDPNQNGDNPSDTQIN